MTDDLHRLLVSSVADEPPVGTPHAAVRRRARQIRQRRQASGAAGVGGLALALAAPAMLGGSGGKGPAGTTPAVPLAQPTTRAPYEGELWPPSNRRCVVDYVPAQPFVEEGPVEIRPNSPGIQAMLQNKPYAQIRPGDKVVLEAEIQARPGVIGFKRIIIGLDRGERYEPIDCDIAGITAQELAGRAVRVSLVVDVEQVPPGTYKGVVLTVYDPGPAGDPSRDLGAADCELGSHRFG